MPSPTPEPPIFHVDGYDVSSYLNLDDAGGDLEAYDVDVGIWYDRHGRVLRGVAPQGRGSGRIVVEVPDEITLEPEALAHGLRGWLVAMARGEIGTQVGLTSEWVSGATLDELVQKAVEYDEAWAKRPRLWSRLGEAVATAWTKVRRSGPR